MGWLTKDLGASGRELKLKVCGFSVEQLVSFFIKKNQMRVPSVFIPLVVSQKWEADYTQGSP